MMLTQKSVNICLEWAAVLYLYTLLLLSGILFWFGFGSMSAIDYAKATGLGITNLDYSVFCITASILTPFIIATRSYSAHLRRTLYALLSLPLASFITLYAIYLTVSVNPQVSILLNLFFFISILIIAGSSFRTLEN